MQLRRGLFRLYLVLSILWVGWFGYVIYESSRSASAAGGFIETYNYDQRIGRPSAYDILDLVTWQNQAVERQKTAVKAILALPILAPVLYFVCGWIVRGFRRDDKHGQTASEDVKHGQTASEDALESRSSKPASTLLLILSVLFFPIVWLVDPGAMANF
jgi:hypothetical protein